MKPIDTARVWLVMAALNEGEVIANTLAGVLAHLANVVVVDDCSTDDTADKALSAGAHVLRHPINLGQGAALQTGIQYALMHGSEYVVTFDADGQHDPEEILPMLKALQESGAEVALGSRFLGNTLKLSWQRRCVLKSAILFTYLTSGIKLSDAHNGFRIMTRRFFDDFDFQQNRMAHASEILNHIAKSRVRYIEFPVTIAYTDYSIIKGQRSADALKILMELFMGKVAK